MLQIYIFNKSKKIGNRECFIIKIYMGIENFKSILFYAKILFKTNVFNI